MNSREDACHKWKAKRKGEEAGGMLEVAVATHFVAALETYPWEALWAML